MALERDEQIALFKRAEFNPITRDHLFAIPNGGTRHPLEARNLKRQGVRPGVSDIFLAYPMGKYHGLWIELKSPAPRKGVLTADQIIWLKRMDKVGYAAYAAYGWEEAWRIIEQYLKTNIDSNINT